MPEWLNVLIRSAGLFVLTLLLVRLIGIRANFPVDLFRPGYQHCNQGNSRRYFFEPCRQSGQWFYRPGGLDRIPALIYLLAIKYKAVRDIVQGKEMVLINHGKVLEDKLMEARLTSEDLLSQLRKKNVFNFADVEFAVLEPTGEVSALLKKNKQAVTPRTLGLDAGQESVPQTVMLDGIIMDEPLTAMGLNRKWLHTELEKVGVAPENVFIAQVDSLGQLYLDLFDDSIQVPKPKTKELVYVTLKKCQADCELYALGTKRADVKKMYANSSVKLLEVIQDLEPLLKK